MTNGGSRETDGELLAAQGEFWEPDPTTARPYYSPTLLQPDPTTARPYYSPTLQQKFQNRALALMHQAMALTDSAGGAGHYCTYAAVYRFYNFS
uniref:Uncharacterized protein n=1 Tax=Macrostomum lignano TaxID=282301 RepID=A0A1I8IXY0_9PLAT